MTRLAVALVVALAACGAEPMQRPAQEQNAKAAPPSAPGTITPGYYGPAGASPATTIADWHMHQITEEIVQVILAASITLDETDVTQLHEAIETLRSTWAAAVDEDVIPDTDDSRDLGSSSKRYAELHVDEAFATSYKFPSSRTRYHTLTASDGGGNMSLAAGVTTDPTNTYPSVAKGSGDPDSVHHWPIHLPQGATITGCQIFKDVQHGSTGDVRAAVIRVDNDANSISNLSTVTPTTGEQVAANTSGSPDTDTLTMDAGSGVRVVDNENYGYMVWLMGTNDSVIDIYAIRIAYTLDEVETP